MFEILTLIQTKKMEKIPIILFNHKFWEPMHKFIKETLVHKMKTVGDKDDELYQIVDNEESIIRVIEEYYA